MEERRAKPGWIKKGRTKGTAYDFTGKKHSEEARRKNAESHKYSIYPKDDTKPEKLRVELL